MDMANEHMVLRGDSIQDGVEIPPLQLPLCVARSSSSTSCSSCSSSSSSSNHHHHHHRHLHRHGHPVPLLSGCRLMPCKPGHARSYRKQTTLSDSSETVTEISRRWRLVAVFKSPCPLNVAEMSMLFTCGLRRAPVLKFRLSPEDLKLQELPTFWGGPNTDPKLEGHQEKGPP